MLQYNMPKFNITTKKVHSSKHPRLCLYSLCLITQMNECTHTSVFLSSVSLVSEVSSYSTYVSLTLIFAVLNISTSAQLSFAMPANFKPPDSPQPASSVSYFPYFGDSYLAVAASLNGGNVMATFVGMLTSWMKELGRHFSPC